MTEEDEENCRNNNVCRFCEKERVVNKVKDHCRWTGNSRGPAPNNCKINGSQKQNNFIPLALRNLSNFDCHLFSKKMVDKKNDKIKF